MDYKVTVIEETRPDDQPSFGSLRVAGVHIWRFDTVNSANIAAGNLRRVLANSPKLDDTSDVTTKVITTHVSSLDCPSVQSGIHTRCPGHTTTEVRRGL